MRGQTRGFRYSAVHFFEVVDLCLPLTAPPPPFFLHVSPPFSFLLSPVVTPHRERSTFCELTARRLPWKPPAPRALRAPRASQWLATSSNSPGTLASPVSNRSVLGVPTGDEVVLLAGVSGRLGVLPSGVCPRFLLCRGFSSGFEALGRAAIP